MLCMLCGKQSATEQIVWCKRELKLCVTCLKTVWEPTLRMCEVAEKYGTVTYLQTAEESIEQIVAEDSRYSIEAYKFVLKAMDRSYAKWFDGWITEIPTSNLAEALQDQEYLAGTMQ